MHAVDWDDLRFVLALARERTLSRAAKAIGVKHTTVARRVRALEQQTGARLFDPHPRGYALTRAGEEAVAIAEAVEQHMHQLDRTVLGRDARLSGPLRITTFEHVIRALMRDLAAFTARYPRVDLELSVDYEPRNLTKREADVAIRLTNHPPENLFGRRVARWRYAAYGARSLVDSRNDATLGDYPWLAWDERNNAIVTERWMRKHVPNARIACRVDHSSAMEAAVNAGLGLTLLPTVVGDADATLQRLTDLLPELETDIWLLIHPDLKNTARVRAFTDHVAGVFAEIPGWALD